MKGKCKMNEIIKGIKERRSIRKYKSDMIPKEIIDEIIDAGLYAANGRGHQATKILAVTDRALRDRLMEMNREIGGWDESFDPFYGAPVVLIVLGEKSWPTYLYDGSLVMGDLMLAAHSLGIGSCWIHRAKQEFESEEGKKILRSLGISDDWEGIGHCILGYPDGSIPEPADRKTDRVYEIDKPI